MNKTSRKFHIVLYLAAAILTVSVCIFTACNGTVRYEKVPVSDSPETSSPPLSSVEPAISAIPATAAPANPTPLPVFSAPVLNFEGRFVTNGCTVICPCFTGANTAKLNKALVDAFTGFACTMKDPCRIDYELTFCERGIISVWVIAYSSEIGQGEDAYTEIERTAFNYDIYSGSEIDISDCFGCEYTLSLAEQLSAMLTASAESDNIELISKIRPVDENQIFVFSHQGMIFYYHLYEIASFEYGNPVLTLSYDSLSGFSAEPESPIGRFLNEN